MSERKLIQIMPAQGMLAIFDRNWGPGERLEPPANEIVEHVVAWGLYSDGSTDALVVEAETGDLWPVSLAENFIRLEEVGERKAPNG